MTTSQDLGTLLRQYAPAFAPMFDIDLNADTVCRLDLSEANTLLQNTDLQDTPAFNAAVQQLLQQQKAQIGVGGYLEKRFIYRRSAHFEAQAQRRNIHLGVDVWADAGTPVYAPLAATVHSFSDNATFGDYGPTIILAHQLENITFYTLFGHLTRTSLEGLHVGKQVSKGEKIAEIGPFPENGDWPPHLHFQLISDMVGKYGDFPGVVSEAEKAMYEQLCPNPILILNCRHLPD